MPLTQKHAVRIIERTWLSYRNRQMFRLLKHAVCAAEQSLSHELLRKLAPNEARFAKETKVSLRLRMRLGGSIFPPRIYFKVYTSSTNLQYFSGANEITMKEGASREACTLMGHRNYSQILLLDQLQSLQSKHSVNYPDEIVTLKDYMRYKSGLDEKSPELGGKNNSWRLLNLEDVPHHRIFHDVVDYAYNGALSSALRSQMPLLLAPPTTAEVTQAQIRLLASTVTRTPTKQRVAKANDESSQRIRNSVLKNGESARRKQQARARAEQMRAVLLGKQDSQLSATTVTEAPANDYASPKAIAGPLTSDDEEAAELYEWSRALNEMSIDRVATAAFSGGRTSTADRQSTIGRSPSAYHNTTDGFRQ